MVDKEYLVEVTLLSFNDKGEQEKSTLKTWANNVAGAIYNMIQLEIVHNIHSIEEVDAETVWDFEDSKLELEVIREMIARRGTGIIKNLEKVDDYGNYIGKLGDD
jgi:hypothetical protein